MSSTTQLSGAEQADNLSHDPIGTMLQVELLLRRLSLSRNHKAAHDLHHFVDTKRGLSRIFRRSSPPTMP